MKKLKLLNSIISLSWLGVLLAGLILMLPLFAQKDVKDTDLNAFCGTKSIEDTINLSDSLGVLYVEGKQLFKRNCASCHNRNMIDNMTGPALRGVEKRWAAFPKNDLYNWIKNAQKLIDEKHPRALALWNEWKSPMTSFPNLTEEEIDALLVYVEN